MWKQNVTTKSLIQPDSRCFPEILFSLCWSFKFVDSNLITKGYIDYNVPVKDTKEIYNVPVKDK